MTDERVHTQPTESVSVAECRDLLRQGGVDDTRLDDQAVQLIRSRMWTLASLVYSLASDTAIKGEKGDDRSRIHARIDR
jgi:hypothetical protein